MATEFLKDSSGRPRPAYVGPGDSDSRRRSRPGGWRTGGWLLLVATECTAGLVLSGGASFLFQEFYARFVVFWGLASALALALIVFPQRAALTGDWQAAQSTHEPWHWLKANLALFASFIVMSVLARVLGGGTALAVWIASLALLAAAFVALLQIDVPPAALWRAARTNAVNVALAVCAGLFTVLLAKLAQLGWEPLAGATLDLTALILSTYEPDVSVRHADFYIRVGTFEAVVAKTCSGYEGIGLVSAFLAIFVAAFRKTLRFPHAFLLFPIGVGVVWLLNSVRIAALISIGAHVSPQMAVDGFHSQAGWIAFVVTSIGLIAFAQSSRFFSVDTCPGEAVAVVSSAGLDEARAGSEERDPDGVGHLAPLMALLATTMIIAAAQPHGHPLYLLKASAIGAALWAYRAIYAGRLSAISIVDVIAGAAVGALWIATAPPAPNESLLAAWLAGQPAIFAVLWLAVRGIGTIVLVPLAEELAFRGFLYRWMISRRYEAVSYSAFSWVALIASSVLFGVLHDRMIAGALAGMVFGLVMIRRNQLSGAIYAHAIANAVIFFWAIAFADASLL